MNRKKLIVKTVNNAAYFFWDPGTNLSTAERPPVDRSYSPVWLIFEKKTQRKFKKYPFHHLCYTYLWNVCQVLKAQESGKVVICAEIQTCTTFLHQTLPVNNQVLPVLRHMWLCSCPVTVMLPGLPHIPGCRKAILHRLTLTSWHSPRIHWGNTICYIFIEGFASS